MRMTLADFMMSHSLDRVRGRVYIRIYGRKGTLLMTDEVILKYSEYIVQGLGTDKNANLFIIIYHDRKNVV